MIYYNYIKVDLFIFDLLNINILYVIIYSLYYNIKDKIYFHDQLRYVLDL